MTTKTRKKTAAKPRERVAKVKRTAAREAKPNQEPSAAFALAKTIVEILTEKHGNNPVILDVRDKSSVTDYFVLVSGQNIPHLRAMFEEVVTSLKKQGVTCYRKTERTETGWLILDYVDVVTHILLEESRKYYAIEDLWSATLQQE